MLTRLAIKNFKSIGDPDVDLESRPLTFLVGKNGAGKSSVLEALALASQRCDIHGSLVYYRTIGEVIHKRESNRQCSIRLFLPSINGDKSLFEETSVRFRFDNSGSVQYERFANTVLTSTLPESTGGKTDNAIEGYLGKWFYRKLAFLRSVRGMQVGPVELADANEDLHEST